MSSAPRPPHRTAFGLRLATWYATLFVAGAMAIAVVTSLISAMVPPMFLIAVTAEDATCCMLAIRERISSVASAPDTSTRLPPSG